MSDKPDCYKCEYRGSAPGSAHSCCHYPGTNTDMFAFFDEGNKELAKNLTYLLMLTAFGQVGFYGL